MKLKNILYIVNSILLIALFGAIYFSIHSNSIGISQVREKYTELSFVDHLKLPKILKNSEKARFAFLIINHEGKDMNYQYTVDFLEKGLSTEITKNQLFINKDGKKQIDVDITMPKKFYGGQVRVNLINPDQTIDFTILSFGKSNL